ncbi:PucR family transcriptional regulator [Streptomyces rugosispiralis]|uniref:Helix-turn-helix domain-containing protein n=1 Tax=Streptomyces rugosispiralis TaxID=2967341 RepID=A0ABT1V7E1_9ACTN|nr:helix-turn-helix domain-containing protein [Streptomyces rugosispiralis]MCQ8193236.1 helix-turn-helix domain-containing protein [Streptomyces rugosispiralis]
MDACRLGDLVDSLALRLHTAPVGPAAPVTEVLLYDAHAPFPRVPGALLLAVGVRPAAAGPLVRAAAEAGMTGIVVRGTDGPVGEAETYGVALLSVDEGASWHHVHLMLASAIGARSAPGGRLGDLFALVDAIAAATGGATSVEDPHKRILAYSTVPGQPVDEDRRQGILGLQVPDSVENTDQVRLVFGSRGPVRLPPLAEGELPRLAVAVRAGGETLGSIWVVDDGMLAADAEKTLAQGASTAALLLLRARLAQELARDQNVDVVRRLLDGSADASTAHRLEWDAVRVAAFVLDSAASVPDAERALLRLLGVVRLQCEARYGQHACVLLDGVVYALLPAPGEHGGEHAPQGLKATDRRHRQLAEDTVRRAARSLRVPVRAALGPVVPSPGGVVDSRADADTVLRLLNDDLPVATVDEVRPRVTLLRLSDVMRERRGLRTGAWRRVLAADAEYGTDYARTLVSWFDAGCDVAGAAKALSVHPNTCRYRLKQVGRQLGIDLEDPDERLVLWLQLRVLAEGSRSAGP